LNGVLEQQIENRFSLFLDLGGGDLILKEHARDLELADLCGRFGIDPVAVHFLGGDLDDLAYLRDIERSNVFTPERTVVVLNEGILPPGRPPARAFAAIQAHEVYRDVVARGARIVVMPRLACMAEVDRRRLMFEDAEASRVKPGQDRIGPINRQMIAIWLRQMNTAFADVADWLP
jgi:hypothetical protein